MTESVARWSSAPGDDGQISLLVVANVLLRWRRTILSCIIAGGLLGVGFGLLSTRVYTSSATFLPQGAEAANSGIAQAASQFGFRVPTGAGVWGPPMYVELLRMRALLEPIVFDTVTVAEESSRRIRIIDLLQVSAPSPDRRIELGVRRLAKMVKSKEVKALNSVQLAVTTPWPSVSFAIAQRLVRGVNEFNLRTRKSQAVAERQFVEARVNDAESTMRDAENRLQDFLQRNRNIAGSPELAFERDRLQREFTLRQQMYSSLMQSRDDARIREVRDTPVITVLEDPRMPVLPDPRNVTLKGTLGALGGALLAILLAFVVEGVSRARRTPSEEAMEFSQLVEKATPRFLRRG